MRIYSIMPPSDSGPILISRTIRWNLFSFASGMQELLIYNPPLGRCHL
jgi:hypothetical protein